MDISSYIEQLNASERVMRLASLRELAGFIHEGKIPEVKASTDVNNHIHTTYSFSPYSPTKAVWAAYQAGLGTCGIMDHDTMSGANEFIEAGKILGIKTTVGMECRVSFENTALRDRRINNPDQTGVVYMALHGVPHQNIDKLKDFFAPLIERRNLRNKKMVSNINKIFEAYDISLDFEKDIIPISQYNDGGSVTERHLMMALAQSLIKRFTKGEKLVGFLKETLKINLNEKLTGLLSDGNNIYYEYDLLGALKSDLVERIYIDAVCPDVKEVIALTKSVGAISAYAYLGDVTSSVTGDKKSQKFEDDYLCELFELLPRLGYNAVTYMPSRNTSEQLKRVRALCEKHELLQISGEDINSPRQNMVCLEQRSPEFANLRDSTYALIGHENAASIDIDNAMFSQKTASRFPSLEKRIEYFKSLA